MPQKRLQQVAGVQHNSATLVGQRGQHVTRVLVDHVLGLNSLEELGDAASVSDDGAVVLRVDEATFEALELDTDG